jgi:hypothetical protein
MTGTPMEMALKKGIVNGDVLQTHNALAGLEFNDPVDHQERIAVGENPENVRDVEDRLSFGLRVSRRISHDASSPLSRLLKNGILGLEGLGFNPALSQHVPTSSSACSKSASGFQSIRKHSLALGPRGHYNRKAKVLTIGG